MVFRPNTWMPTIEMVTFAYSCLAGFFIFVVLLPIPTWKVAMEIWFPFMYSLLGRAAVFILMGPLLLGVHEVGITFGIISILNGVSYLIAFFILRKDNFKKSFLRPLDEDRSDKEEYLWEDFQATFETPAPTTTANKPQQQQQPQQQQNTPQYNPFDSESAKNTDTSVPVAKAASSPITLRSDPKEPIVSSPVPLSKTLSTNPFDQPKVLPPGRSRSILQSSHSSSVSSSPSPPPSRTTSLRTEPKEPTLSSPTPDSNTQPNNPFDSATPKNPTSNTNNSNPFS